MSDVFAEVQEAIKQEKLDNFLKNYGGYILVFAIAIILGTAANSGYKAWREDADTKQTNVLLPALDKHDPAALLDNAKSMNAPLAAVAQLNAAGAYMEKGDTAKALALYDELATSKKIAPEYSELAHLMSLRLIKDMPVDIRLSNLQRMADNAGNAWRHHARMDAALILAHDVGNYTDARAQLDLLIKDPTAPETLKQKATSLDVLFAAKKDEKATAPAEKTVEGEKK